jgi:hypothetical protein
MDHELLRLERLKMAHAEARRIVAGMSNDKVKVVGVDNDQNFKDYIKE